MLERKFNFRTIIFFFFFFFYNRVFENVFIYLKITILNLCLLNKIFNVNNHIVDDSWFGLPVWSVLGRDAGDPHPTPTGKKMIVESRTSFYVYPFKNTAHYHVFKRYNFSCYWWNWRNKDYFYTRYKIQKKKHLHLVKWFRRRSMQRYERLFKTCGNL